MPASFRPWLRDEFSFRCVFCLRREQWDRASSLEVEHFLPSRRFPAQRLKYDNLFYACSRCNSAKGNRSIDDPSQTLVAGNASVSDDGRIIGQSDESRRLIQALRLNSAEAVHYRRLWIEFVAMAKQFAPERLHQLMQFPDDLPDLSRLKPPTVTLVPMESPNRIAQNEIAVNCPIPIETWFADWTGKQVARLAMCVAQETCV